MENVRKSKETAEDLFFKFMDAQDCPEITSTFRELVKLLGIKADNPREFYSLLKGKLQSWRCKSLWELLDSRVNQKEYGKGKICEDTHVLVIGAGPIGLRTAIEVALLGAKVVIVEKRESFVRNNVLHLWPFLLTDFRSLGAKKFYGKFCSGSIDHISIRRLQGILLKAALIFGAKLYTGVTFDHVIEPNSLEDGWKCKVSPESHPVSKYEFDVLIGADGKKNVIPGFQQIEMRGTLAIGITANFVNHCTEEEANVEEISGIAYQFNPHFFDQLLEEKGIKLENIVYYKDETHYFVMTAGKTSLIKRGALKEDLSPPVKLLAPSNIDQSKLLEYVTDVVRYATKSTLKNLELKIVGNNQPDIAAFDFTSIKKAENAARIIERKGSKLLVGLVGDSLLEPFWPTGSGCARGVLSALDAAWTIRSFAQDKPPLQILSERENIYRLLSGTSAENLHKDHAKYTINPSTRYLHITHKRIREVYHLFDTDDPVNADFSIGSPQTEVLNKASRRRKISTGAKFTSNKGRKRGRASSHLAADLAGSRIRSTSGSSMENLVSHKPLSSTRSVPLDSKVTEHMLSLVESDDEVFETKTRRVRINPTANPLTGRRRSTIESSGDELKDKRRKTTTKKTLSKENSEGVKENTRRKKGGFFGFGKGKAKRKPPEDSDYQSDKDHDKMFKGKHGDNHQQMESKFGNGVTLKNVQPRKDEKKNFAPEDSEGRRPAGSFSREQYTRRSARDIIREMEARSKTETGTIENTGNGKVTGNAFDANVQQNHKNYQTNKEGEKNEKHKADNKKVEQKAKIKKEDEKKKHKEEEKKRKEEERKKKEEEKRKQDEEKKRKEEGENKRKKKDDEIKRREQANNQHNKRSTESKIQTTPTNKKSKKQSLLDEIAALSPSARRAMPVLSKLSPQCDKENEKLHEHTVTSAVRDAAMLLMVTPLLVDGMIAKNGMDRKGSWLGRSSGRVRDVVNRYNTLNNMKPLIDQMNGDVTPLKRPRDGVDGSEEKPRKIDNGYEKDDGNEKYSTEENNDSFEVKPTPPSEKKKALQMRRDERQLMPSPSLERLKIKLQDFQDDSPRVDSDVSSPNGHVVKDFSSPIWQKTVIAKVSENNDQSKENEPREISKKSDEDTVDGKLTACTVYTPINEEAIRDFSSPTWQKTAIAVVAEINAGNKEHNKDSALVSSKGKEVTEESSIDTKPSQGRRRSSVFPSELMEEKLTNMLNSTSALRARESIKYMITVFKQIQKHPNEEKYYRIFKGRAKFRKHVWTVKNAKLFMTESGWTEIGSFLIFPLSKQIEGPLQLLNKYLSLAEEKSMEEHSSPAKAEQSNLRRASSTDLADRIMELKEALVSSKTNFYKTNKVSNGIKNRESKILQRAVSMDEVNILRRNGETSSTLRKESTTKDDECAKPQSHVEEKENEPGCLRRSVSENALDMSSENYDELTSTFLPFTRRFSQRSVKEQETPCDIVMENPLHMETVPVDENSIQGSISSSDEEDLIKPNKLITAPHQRQSVRSPQKAVLQKAEQLSSVLGNLIDTLGSSTDSERETESEKATKKELQNGKVKGKIPDQNKDGELEALCATLDLLIHDNSDSSSESAKENTQERKPYSLRQRETRKGDLKPPLPYTRKTTQQMEKSKSVDNSPKNSKRSSMANGRSNRDRISKAKSVDVSQVISNRRPKDRSTSRSQDMSKTNQKNTTDRRESSVKTRTQRQKEANNAASLDTRSTNRQDTARKKATKRTDKRPALKTKSFDIERSRTRPPVAKSKSLDQTENKTTRRSQVKKGSGRSSGSEDDNKKPPRLRLADQTRMKTRAQNVGRANNRAPLSNNSTSKGDRSITEQGEVNAEPSRPVLENSTKKGPSAQTSSRKENSGVKNQDYPVNIDESVTSTEKNPCDQVIKDQDDSWTVINIKPKSVAEQTAAEDHANLEVEKEKNEIHLVEADKSNDVLVETSGEIINLSKEIQSHYSESENDTLCNSVDDNTKETNKQDGVLKEKQWFPGDSEFHVGEDGDGPSAARHEGCHDEVDSRIKKNGNPVSTQSASSDYTQTDSQSRKMTLLDIGKQQSRERVKRREVVSLSLEERKQQILDAAITKPKSKPADKRRSILQIKSRSDGNLVKNKKEEFEKPKVAHTTSDSSVAKSSKQRYFRLRGRKKKSFELSSEPLEVLTEGQEESIEDTPAANGKYPTNQVNGVTANAEQIDEKVDKGKNHSPARISPFQLHFRKRSGSYDLEKRSSSAKAN